MGEEESRGIVEKSETFRWIMLRHGLWYQLEGAEGGVAQHRQWEERSGTLGIEILDPCPTCLKCTQY